MSLLFYSSFTAIFALKILVYHFNSSPDFLKLLKTVIFYIVTLEQWFPIGGHTAPPLHPGDTWKRLETLSLCDSLSGGQSEFS